MPTIKYVPPMKYESDGRPRIVASEQRVGYSGSYPKDLNRCIHVFQLQNYLDSLRKMGVLRG